MPSIEDLKVFGYLCFASTLAAKIGKVDNRARKCVFLGYRARTKGFVLYDLVSRETLVSRDVMFYKDEFPFLTKPHTTQSSSNPQPNTCLPTPNTLPHTEELFPQPAEHLPLEPDHFPLDGPPSPDNPPPNLPTIDSTKNRTNPSYLTDYHCYLATYSHPPPSSNTKYPISNFLSYDKLSQNHRTYSIALSTTIEPSSFKQAIREDCGQQAIQAELDALDHNYTWKLMPLPPGKSTVGCKWGF